MKPRNVLSSELRSNAISSSRHNSKSKKRRKSSLTVSDDEIFQLVSKKVEALRKQALLELQSPDNDASKKITALHEILFSYGIGEDDDGGTGGNELKKGWRGFSLF
jgi:hypothetical protein